MDQTEELRLPWKLREVIDTNKRLGEKLRSPQNL